MQPTRIPTLALPGLEGKLAKLNAKSAKLGLPPMTIKVVAEGQVEDRKTGMVQPWAEVVIEGEPPKVAGWTMVATLQHTPKGNVIHSARPHERRPNLPDEYREREPWCDHCNVLRRRNDTYVMQHEDGSYKQVASKCMQDFLGHDPKAVLTWAKSVQTIEDLAETYNAEHKKEHGELDPDAKSWGYWQLPPAGFLANVAAVMRVDGQYISRKSVYQTGGLSTADKAFTNATASTLTLPLTDEDWDQAAETLAWLRDDVAKRSEISEYFHNLVVCANNTTVDNRMINILASAIYAYQRDQRQQKQQPIVKGVAHVGVVGERYHFGQCSVVDYFGFTGYYGPGVCVKFADHSGNLVVWFTTANAADKLRIHRGDMVVLSARIKKHSSFKGEKQTVIARPTVL